MNVQSFQQFVVTIAPTPLEDINVRVPLEREASIMGVYVCKMKTS